jgi:hypothetical protein
MKKIIYIVSAACLLLVGSTQKAVAQPVSDHAVVPVAVTLNQILRLNVTNGGNIEFVFNTISDYDLGIANSAAYDTDITIASSTRWSLEMFAESGATMTGTDNVANLLDTDYIGFQLEENGAHNFAGQLIDSQTAVGVAVALPAVSTTIITSGAAGAAATSNAGNVLDNIIVINWECNTAGLNAVTGNTELLNVDEDPDRYVTNVLLDLTAL